MPEDQIAQLVTETLAAVGLKVCAMMDIYMIMMATFFIKKCIQVPNIVCQ